ncbi:MAG: hypothetical protein L0Y56_20140, partial [Nitrospira sp.]|nr:hypothetical protein [Nitrospira sp.]
MDDELKRLIRETYPFPIAHAHKKTLAFLDDNTQKLKCLIQTAETTIQFLALVVLAQLNRDLEQAQAPALGSIGTSLPKELRNPSFGKWQGIVRDTLRTYWEHRHKLVLPELFDLYFDASKGKRLPLQPVVGQAIDPLIQLRNQFHHPGIPDALTAEKIEEGTQWLDQLLEELQFLSHYQLSYIQRIEVRRQARQIKETRIFSHELVQLTGCFTNFDRYRWESEVDLQAGRIALIALKGNRRNLILDPFVTFADQAPISGIFDVFLLNGTELRRVRYLSSQFGQEIITDKPEWPQGEENLEALGRFFDLL